MSCSVTLFSSKLIVTDMDNSPNISTPSWPSSGAAGLLIMLDLDTPYENTRVSSLHWLVTGVTLTNKSLSPSQEHLAELNIPSPQVDYQQPEPPIVSRQNGSAESL
jgi:hypothetical protein